MADEKRPRAQNALVQAESMVQAVLALPLGCALGWLFGTWIDRKVGTHWVSIVGILMGAVGGFIQLIRTAMRFTEGK